MDCFQKRNKQENNELQHIKEQQKGRQKCPSAKVCVTDTRQQKPKENPGMQTARRDVRYARYLSNGKGCGVLAADIDSELDQETESTGKKFLN